MKWALAIAVIAATTRSAAADTDSEAERAFGAAQAGSDIGALEAVGRALPVSRWTDNAWAEAARVAEARGDYARARADLAQVVATADDEVVRRRAQAALARLAATTGAAGQWDLVVAEHARLASAILGATGDPKPAIADLAALVAAHPDYPGATAARIVVAQGWQLDGDRARSIAVLDEAVAAAPTPETRGRARYAAFHARVADRELAGARADLAAIGQTPGADPAVIAQLSHELDRAELRAHIGFAAWCALAAAALVTTWRARRDAGSWRAAARAFARPPIEVWYLAPLMLALVLVAQGGNPMVARALRAIALVGIAVSWLSGAALHLAPRPVGLQRVAAHIGVLVIALAGCVFLVVDRDRLLDLLLETWRSGPALP